MDDNQLKQLTLYIAGLTEATRVKRVVWTRANPTTYVWGKIGEHNRVVGQVVLQQIQSSAYNPAIGQNIRKVGYVLQVSDPTRGEVLNINSIDEARVQGELATLFQTVTAASAVDGIDFLGGLVKP